MTNADYQTLRANHPFPWTERMFNGPHGKGGFVQVLDARGQEVPLFTLIAFTKFITARLASQESPK